MCYDLRSMSKEINILIDDDYKNSLGAGWLKGIASQVLKTEGIEFDVELSVVITGQEVIRELNRKYLDSNEPTDVLAFATRPELPIKGECVIDYPAFVSAPDGVEHLGEVIISYSQAVIQAGERHHSVEREISLLVIHGILHLLGYDHEKPKQTRLMRTTEAEILNEIIAPR